MDWVKFATNSHQDAKLMELSDGAYRLFMYSLSLSGSSLTFGVLSARQLRSIGAGKDKFRRTLGELLAQNLLYTEDGETYYITNWEKYQETREQWEKRKKTSRESTARNREKVKGGDVSLTLTEEKREEEILKEDTIVSSKKQPPPVQDDDALPIAEPKPKKPRKKPAAPLPEDWKPKPKHAGQAEREGLSLADEAFKFRAHAQANDRRQVDWDAAFRLWLTNAKSFGRCPAPPRSVEMPADRVRRGMEIAEELRIFEERRKDGYVGNREIANQNRALR